MNCKQADGIMMEIAITIANLELKRYIWQKINPAILILILQTIFILSSNKVQGKQAMN
jgi:hypothetical protein